MPHIKWKCKKCGRWTNSLYDNKCLDCLNEENPSVSFFNPPEKDDMEFGWRCPVCGAVISPQRDYCPFCTPKKLLKSAIRNLKNIEIKITGSPFNNDNDM